MPKTYKNVNGTWQPIKKIFTKIAGTWVEAKKVYKKISGNWVTVHNSNVDYIFPGSVVASSWYGVPLSNYVNPASADIFNITIPAGVYIIGSNGGNGGNGYTGGDIVYNCHGSGYYWGTNGGTGGTGGYALDLRAFAGKTVNIYNNGTIRGGTGGTGGNGGNGGTPGIIQIMNGYGCYGAAYGGCGGAGGAGGAPILANAMTLNVFNIGLQNGYTGQAGQHGIDEPGDQRGSDGCCGCNAE